jgi:hypothetical protein
LTNPFENGRSSSDGAATPDLVSADAEEHSQESKRAPTRAIFDDLTTAVSSIRSGSARGRYRSDSYQVSDVTDEDTAIPLQDLQHTRHHEDSLVALDLAILSPATRSSQLSYFEVNNATFAARDELPLPVTQPQPPDRPWNPFRRTLAAFSSSLARGSASDVASRWPRNSSDPLEPVKRRASGHITGFFQDNENGSPATPSQNNSNSDSWTKFRKCAGQSSLQEGSTIVNIVKQYKGSDIDSNGGVSYDLHSRPTTSFDPQLSQLSDDSFLSDSKEENTASPHPDGHRQTQHFTKEHANQPPRYGLPRLPNHGFPRSEARNDLASVNSNSEDLDLTSSEIYDADPNNPFSTPRDQRSTRYILDGKLNNSDNGQARQPLEHDIMQLRHRSDYSIYSNDSFSTIRQGSSIARPSRHTQPAQAQMERHPSEVVSVDEETRRLAEPVLFYDQAAIDPNWNINGEGLRVPIREPNRNGNSSQRGLGASRGTDLNPDDDPEDWETVVTDQGDHEAAYQRGLGWGIVGRNESSMADDSEEGAFSTYQEISGFNSTDRIVQHPGKVHYHGDYRQLELKNTKVPVMAPKYGAHRVNGYAADSMRTRSPYPYYTSPSPLAQTHTNPFNSQPPEVMSPKVRQPTGMPKPYRGKNYFPPSSKASSVVTDSSEAFPRATVPKPKLAGTNNSKAWTDVQDENDSIFSTQNSLFVGHDVQNRRSSWDHVTTFAKGGSIPGYNHDGSRTTPHNDLPDSSDHQISRAQADGFTEVDLYSGKDIDFDRRPTNRPNRRHSGKNPRNDFVYRSPLAPPQRDSCRALYTKSQLGRIDFVGPVVGNSRTIRESPFDQAFQRHTSFAGLRQRQIYDREEADRRRKKISNVCLGLCNLFPPLLILYATGNLDAFIFWWSKAEFTRFKARQKQLACYLVGAWAAVLMVVLIVVLIVWKVHGSNGHNGPRA